MAALFAACVRFSDLGAYGLWIDEAFSISDATTRLDREGGGNVGNPLFYQLFKIGLDLFGRDEWGARILPCAVGVAVVFTLVYWLALRIGAVAAIAAAALLSLSPWAHFLSQSARYYTLTQLGCLIAGIAFEAWLRRRRLRDGVVAALALGLAAEVHTSSLLFGGGLVAAGFLRSFAEHGAAPRRARAWYARGELWLGAALLLALAYVGWEDGLRHLRAKGKFSLPVYAGNLAFYGGPVLWLAAFAAAWHGLAKRSPFALFCVGAAGGTLLCGALLSVKMTVNHQYVVAALPFLVAAVAWMVGEVHRHGGRALAFGLLAMPCVEALAMQALYRGPFGGFRADWRQAASIVLENLEPDDLVVSNRPEILEHYLAPNSVDLRDARRVLLLGYFNHEMLIDVMRHPGRVWYLLGEDGASTWDAVDRESFQWHVRTRCRRFAELPRQIGTKELGIEIWLQAPRGAP